MISLGPLGEEGANTPLTEVDFKEQKIRLWNSN